jgi:outer membrane receptor protein involved in Fe transport
MGGAFIAVADDANAIFYNPAGMGLIQGKGIKIETIYQDFSWEIKGLSSYSHNFSERGINLCYAKSRIGIAYSWFRRGDRKLELDVYNYHGNIIGKFKWLYDENLVTLAYGKEIEDNIYMGMAGTYAHFDFDGDDIVKFFKSNENLSLDIGFLYKPLQKTALGLTIQNILSTKSDYPIVNDIDFTGAGEDQRLPINVNLGLSYKWNRVLISADLTNLFNETIESVEYKPGFHIGTEIRPRENLALRLGYAIEKTTLSSSSKYYTKHTSSFGLGYKIGSLKFNGAITLDNRGEKLEENSLVKGNTNVFLLKTEYAF